MNQQLTLLLKRFTSIKSMGYRHRIFMFVLVVASMYGFMLYHINTLANTEPNQAAIDAKLQEIKRVNIDKEAIRQIEELEARNIDLEALFDNGRENPFQE